MSSIVRLFRRNSNDRDRFVSLVRPHVELMYRMACRWTGNQADAEDLVQAVLTKLAGRTEELSRIDSLRPWLIKVVYRQFVDETRLAHNRLEVVESDLHTNHQPHAFLDFSAAGLSQPDSALALQDLLEKALAQLEKDHLDVILLHDAEGYTLAEIARILDISTGTVKSRLHRARGRVKKFIQEGTL